MKRKFGYADAYIKYHRRAADDVINRMPRLAEGSAMNRDITVLTSPVQSSLRYPVVERVKTEYRRTAA